MSQNVEIIIPLAGKGRESRAANCIACFKGQDCKIAVIEQVMDGSRYYESLESDRYISIEDHTRRGFNLSWCYNCGVLSSEADVVVLVDSDMLTPPNYVEEVRRTIGSDCFAFGAKEYHLLQPDGSVKVKVPGKPASVGEGHIQVFKTLYYKEVPKLENLFNWGCDDWYSTNRYCERFMCKRDKIRRVNAIVQHQWHPESERDQSNLEKNQQLVKWAMALHEKVVLARMQKAGIGNPAKPGVIDL